jgi:hypothetical protein
LCTGIILLILRRGANDYKHASEEARMTKRVCRRYEMKAFAP